MKNLYAPVGANNIGGNVEFYFIPINLLVSVPRAVGNTIDIASIVYTTVNDAWFYGFCIQQSIGAKTTPSRSSSGNVYKHIIEGMCPTDNVDFSELFNEMLQHRFILIRRDTNNYYKLLGSIDNPLIFSWELDTQTEFAGNVKGYKIKFECECEVPEYFVEGEFPLDYSSPVTAAYPQGLPGISLPAHAIVSHSDVNAAGLANGMILKWDVATSKWIVASLSHTIASHSDVNAVGLADGMILKWDVATSKWIVAAPSAGYTNEEAQDTVAAMIAAGTHDRIEFSYNDPGGSISSTITRSIPEKMVLMTITGF